MRLRWGLSVPSEERADGGWGAVPLEGAFWLIRSA